MSQIEILSIGDELVEGRLVDTNAAWLSEQLGDLGYKVHRHTTIGDAYQPLVQALLEVATRNKVVLVTGGLGPTTDDLTSEAAAEAFDAPLEERAEARDHVTAYFTQKGRPISPNNYKQARLPKGSTLIPNPNGTAVGFKVEILGCHLYFMPGVPHEMYAMFKAWAAPDLAHFLTPRPAQIMSLKLYGIGESNVGQKLDGLEEMVPKEGRFAIQYRASFPEIHVRFILEGFENSTGASLLQTLGDEAEKRLGHYIFAKGGATLKTTFPEVVLAEAREKGFTLATAESCTGGMIGALLTSVPGSSDVFRGGIIAYHNDVKMDILSVRHKMLEDNGAVSQKTVETMAESGRRNVIADFCIAVSGIAGPGGGTPEKPVGTVWVAIASPSGTSSRHFHMPLSREKVRILTCYAGLALLRQEMRKTHAPLNRGLGSVWHTTASGSESLSFQREVR